MGSCAAVGSCSAVESCNSEAEHRKRVSTAELSGLAAVVECCHPLLFEIVDFLAASPRDFAVLCGMSARFVRVQMIPVEASVWRAMYAQKWPAFYECLTFEGFTDWHAAYRETWTGLLECGLEIFDREKNPGFAMAAMPARLRYEAGTDCYVASWVSACAVYPERIPLCEEHRLRFCPEAVRAQLVRCPQVSGSSADAMASSPPGFSDKHHYPYRVLEGFEGLRVGCRVELQWKKQQGSPFGWWYGHLDDLTAAGDGLAKATISFRHFPVDSPWYQAAVVFGNSKIRVCPFGGFTGGIRAVSEAESRQAMRFFPELPKDNALNPIQMVPAPSESPQVIVTVP